MNRKRKSHPVYHDVEITAMAAEGKAVGRLPIDAAKPTEPQPIVFVAYAAPGDVCDIQIIKKKRSYLEGRIIGLKKPSPARVQPLCPHFTVCGGCRWQHVPYEIQLEHKAQQVRDAMERIGHLTVGLYLPILGCSETYRYRNKLEFTFSQKRWFLPEELPEDTVEDGGEFSAREMAGLGFHIPGRFDKVLDVEHCYLGSDLSDEIRLFVRRYCVDRLERYPFYDLRAQHGFMRTLMIRTTSIGETMVLLSFAEERKEERIELLEALRLAFPQITALMYVINTKSNDSLDHLTPEVYYGRNYIVEEMEGLKFSIRAKSFYQTNSHQAYELYKVVRSFSQLSGEELVYDLYTGTGTIANFISKDAKSVIGVEYVEDAVADARVNSKVNGIDNCTFLAGDMKDVLTEEFIEEYGRPDVIIADPPRAGMHKDVLETILKAEPSRIVYVSCNPATQARDLQLLTASGVYRISRSQAVDMFPHTQHIENVVLLEKQ